MKTITESQAQELANLSGLFVAVDSDNEVFLYDEDPHTEIDNWNTYAFSQNIHAKIRIASERPWNEQIWRPE